MTTWLKAQGTFWVDEKARRIAVSLSNDFIDYYNWHITRHHGFRLHTPAFGAHITITTPKIRANVSFDRAKRYHADKITFEYDPDLIRGGKTKGFIMYYVKIRSEDLKVIAADLGFGELDKLHITIANGKAGVMPFWFPMITIKK